MIKGKRIGSSFERKVREVIREKGFYIYVKGVSTPGPDIFAIRKTHSNIEIILLELKSYKEMKNDILNKFKKQIDNLYKEKEKLESVGFNEDTKFYIGLIFYSRNDKKYYFVTKDGTNEFKSLHDLFEYLIPSTKDLTEFLIYTH
jgi:Holliday junction resolvase